MDLHPAEEATVRAFVIPERRPRFLEQMASAKRRRRFLDRLNHCRDFDPRFVVPGSDDCPLLAELLRRGALATCHVISGAREIDGRDLSLAEALEATREYGWGTILCCLPGRLAYYRDEAGTRREFLLVRDA